MDECNGEPSDGIAVGAGGAAPRGKGAAPRAQVAAGRAAGTQGGAQRAIGEPPDLRALLEALRRTDSPSATMAIPRALHARFELDDRMVGMYMRDAIERGGTAPR